MAVSDQIIDAESGGNPNATNPNSSATGPGQFLNSTWMDLVNKYRPDLASGMSPQDILGLRSDPQLSREMTANYANENGQYLAQKGLPVTPSTTYLAHFAGPQGAAKILSADPDAPVSDILGRQVVSANPFLKDMKASDLRAWADKKMAPSVAGPPSPMMGTPQQPQPGMPQQQQPAQQMPAQQQMAQLPSLAGMPSQSQQILSPEMQALMPILNAPIRNPKIQFNLAQALQKIPVPQGFKGYS